VVAVVAMAVVLMEPTAHLHWAVTVVITLAAPAEELVVPVLDQVEHLAAVVQEVGVLLAGLADQALILPIL
jgi:hypothetical protein